MADAVFRWHEYHARRHVFVSVHAVVSSTTSHWLCQLVHVFAKQVSRRFCHACYAIGVEMRGWRMEIFPPFYVANVVVSPGI